MRFLEYTFYYLKFSRCPFLKRRINSHFMHTHPNDRSSLLDEPNFWLRVRDNKAPPTLVTSARFCVASFEVDTAKRKEVEEKDCSASAVARRPSFSNP
ncbi:hypothetical protein AVEN_251145-1 [Araneus ventricosus]|uniref:Uncharacterized protein n=1 Tax=Araneus ventricosus TaxID=182803 RepID=A0A4Y2WVI0_ARAVE|nr:hypothetical protein AVEN_251145-1 [Araneus ventricosus]